LDRSINNDDGMPNVQNASLVMQIGDKMSIEWNEKENDLNISCKNQLRMPFFGVHKKPVYPRVK
jgi:hypothetical protein